MVGLLAAPAAGVLSLLGASPAGEGSDVPPPSLLPEMTEELKEEVNSLARIMIAEAVGEGAEGMQAVGNVIWNRMRNSHPTLGFKNQNTAQSVIKAPGQFEGWKNKDGEISELYKNAHLQGKNWELAKSLATHQLIWPDHIADLSDGMLFYRNPNAPGQDNPEAWFHENYLDGKLVPHKKIRNHVFYRWNEEGTPDTKVVDQRTFHLDAANPPRKPQVPTRPSKL